MVWCGTACFSTYFVIVPLDCWLHAFIGLVITLDLLLNILNPEDNVLRASWIGLCRLFAHSLL